MIDFSSVTKPVEIVDNNSNHTPTSSGETYRITSDAHNRESCNSLTSKVNQVLPLFNPTKGLEEGFVYKTEVVTSSGTQEFTLGIEQKRVYLFSLGQSLIKVLLYDYREDYKKRMYTVNMRT